jgi:2-polyprenyl-3-methyl-5-hydroxy-6-metoxy-1,4-benzoquinol methylase
MVAMLITEEMIPVLPQYLRAPKPNVYAAVFPTKEIKVDAGRSRRYPGLLGVAPDTRALYDAAAQVLSGAGRVLDFGCGSGIGTAELRCHFQNVTAVDSDPAAIEFAGAYLRSVTVACDDGISEVATEQQHDAVVIVDVLGQSPSPDATLRQARRWLAPDGRLFIAEPRANPAQALLPPMLRAFSKPSLTTCLARAGLEVVDWIEGAGNFVACVARPSASEHYRALAEADAALAAGRPELALVAYSSVSADAPRAVRTEALLGRAELLANCGELQAACQAVLDAAALSPDDARSLAGLSEVSLITGDGARSLELAIGALERDPCDPNAVQSLARAAASLQEDEAFAAWRIANALVPSDLGVATELSRLAALRGQLPYAIWVMERLQSFHAELGVDYHVTLAWLYATAERLGDARLEGEIARVKDPDNQGVKELWAHLVAS